MAILLKALCYQHLLQFLHCNDDFWWKKYIYHCFSLTSYEAVCCLSDVIVVVEEQVIISAFAGGAEADTCPEGTGVEVGTGHESSGVSGNCIETQPMSVFWNKYFQSRWYTCRGLESGQGWGTPIFGRKIFPINCPSSVWDYVEGVDSWNERKSKNLGWWGVTDLPSQANQSVFTHPGLPNTYFIPTLWRYRKRI